MPNLSLKDEKIQLRLVEKQDAEFILSLRLDNSRAQFLNETDASVKKQEKWIEDYKVREADKKEYYFLIEDDANQYGTIRVYKVEEDRCYWGSWITKPGSPKGFGKRALVLTLKFIFEDLKKEKAIFTVEQENLQGKKLYQELGSSIIDENGKELTFLLQKNDFYNTGLERLQK
jgi:RimJ/RimL family protein N-acetyltransferase